MHEDTILVVENHYLGAVLDRNQFDTFYHEHPRTYSLSSFIEIAQSLGRAVIEVQFPQRYGGNVRVFIGKVDSASEASTKVIILRLNVKQISMMNLHKCARFLTSGREKKRQKY
jgi:hypothetical protein